MIISLFLNDFYISYSLYFIQISLVHILTQYMYKITSVTITLFCYFLLLFSIECCTVNIYTIAVVSLSIKEHTNDEHEEL